MTEKVGQTEPSPIDFRKIQGEFKDKNGKFGASFVDISGKSGREAERAGYLEIHFVSIGVIESGLL